MAASSPMAKPMSIQPVPPEESNGSAMPLVGASPVTTARLTSAWTMMVSRMPNARSRWNGRAVLSRIRKPAKSSAK